MSPRETRYVFCKCALVLTHHALSLIDDDLYFRNVSQQVPNPSKSTQEDDTLIKQQARAKVSSNSKAAQNRERAVKRLMRTRKINREVVIV